MDSPYSDGGPSVSSYTGITYPDTIQQQSSPMQLFVKTGSFPILPPSSLDEQQQHLPDTSFYNTQTACHPSQQLRAAAYSSDVSAHMTPQSSHQPSPQQVWSSPPLCPGDLQNCIPFQDSPTSASLHLPCYTHSPSPTAWSSPTPSFLQPHGAFQQQQQQQSHPTTIGSPSYLRICTPESSKEFPLGGSDIPTPYTGSFFPESEVETSCLTPSPMMTTRLLPTVPTSCSSAGSPDGLCAGSPASAVATVEAPAGERQEQGLVKSFTLSTLTELDTAEPAKDDEPYAKLIYRAIISQPGHAMTLQDIYQWFRDHTDKAREEKKGWQNSIRHNLSMNAAFTRRDRKQDDGSAPPAIVDSGSKSKSGDSKRICEWALEDWAVRDGVQSTTRYRKEIPGKEVKCTNHPNGSGVGRYNSQQHSSTRALNGRKGGWAASMSRASKRGHQHQHHGRLQYALMRHEFDSPSMSNMANPTFSSVVPVSRLEPTPTQTPIAHVHDSRMGFAPETAPGSFGLQMEGLRLDQRLAGASAGPGGIHHHPVSVVGQGPPMYLAPSPMGEYPFGIADVQLNYSGDPRNAEISESARLFDNMNGNVGDWNNHHGL